MKTFQLIDGQFSSQQAQQILGAMIKSKIDYHSLEAHSEDEMRGIAGQQSRARLKRLQGIDSELREYLSEPNGAERSFRIKGTIEIEEC